MDGDYDPEPEAEAAMKMAAAPTTGREVKSGDARFWPLAAQSSGGHHVRCCGETGRQTALAATAACDPYWKSQGDARRPISEGPSIPGCVRDHSADRMPRGSAAKNALRLNRCYPGPYRCLVSAFAHLGRDAEAREAVARMLEIDPGFTMSAWIDRCQLSKTAKLMIEGFRKAGLPE